MVSDADARGSCLGDFSGRGNFFVVSPELTGNREKKEQMLAAAAFNKNTLPLSFSTKSAEKEELQELWSKQARDQKAGMERYNKSQMRSL